MSDQALERFMEQDDLSEDEWEAYREELREAYQAYITNPRNVPGANFALWTSDGDGHEYPVVNLNTGTFPVFRSRFEDVGDGALELTDEFFHLVGTAFHEAMCFMPDVYFEGDQFEETVELVYGEQTRDHEIILADILIRSFTLSDNISPELEPLADWAGRHTEFGVPALGEPADGNTDDTEAEA